MQIPEDARWMQRRIYSTLYVNYVLKGMDRLAAITKALDDSGYATAAFEKKFPSFRTVDTTATDAESAPVDPRPAGGAKMHPGIPQVDPNTGAPAGVKGT